MTTAETTEAAQTQSPERAAISDWRQMQLFYDPPGTLRLTVGDAYSYPSVKLYQASPLSAPGRYLSLLNGKGEEIALVPALCDLPPDSRTVAEADLQRRYLTAMVRAITAIRTEFGVTYWNVVTNRGDRDFVIQNLSESCVWLSDAHLLLIDVDGNRFEITDRFALDPDSLARLNTVL